MREDTVVQLRQPGSFEDDPLTEVFASWCAAFTWASGGGGSCRFVEAYAHLTDSAGRRRIVRHGHLPEREIQTGIGPVAVRCPRVRDRGAGETGPRVRFTSRILPPYLRRAKSIEELLPWLPTVDDIAWLGGWEGYRVSAVERTAGARPEVVIFLSPAGHRAPICDGCGASVYGVHDSVVRRIRDLPILDARTWLDVPRRRVSCPRCGPSLERLSWLDRYSRVTRRLAESVARLCQVLPIKHVAAFFGLGWDAVKAIDKRHLMDTLGAIDLSGVSILAMDEFAIHKGHRYATVIIDPTIKKVLWVGRGRGREDIRPFFELLGSAGRDRIKAVAMDMNGAYEAEVRAQCPDAEIVFDLFHVVAKFGREVVNRVRVDEANRLADDKPARKVVKSARWLLLRNRDNIKRQQDLIRLDELLAANHALMTVYVLKEDLKGLWKQRTKSAAKAAWESWFCRAIESAIKPLVTFARKLEAYLPGIIAHATWPLNTSLLEGFNNKIKVIKRMAYGFRDDEYFFLKIRAAFPGIPGLTSRFGWAS